MLEEVVQHHGGYTFLPKKATSEKSFAYLKGKILAISISLNKYPSDCLPLFSVKIMPDKGRPGRGGGGGGGGSGIPIYPKKNRQNSPKCLKFLQIYPKIIEALNTLYPQLEVSETNTSWVVLHFLAFLQMGCHYFPTITDHKKRPHVSLKGKMVGYG